ncbi:MAG: hypothetical protein H7Y03_11565 [Chitinophagaceae bacterium]|nr:hypothetical protein [Chitinophagaceae bacterium]
MTYEELIENHSASVIENLVRTVVSQDPVEIRFDYMDDDQWAIITMHEYEEDKQVSVRLHADDLYDLYFCYYDDEDEFFEILKPLSEEEKEILPNGLKKLMKKVLKDEKGIRIAGNFLSH